MVLFMAPRIKLIVSYKMTIKMKMAFFVYPCRNNRCNYQNDARGKQKWANHEDIKKWYPWKKTRLTEHRTVWRKRSCAAGMGIVRTAAAD